MFLFVRWSGISHECPAEVISENHGSCVEVGRRVTYDLGDASVFFAMTSHAYLVLVHDNAIAYSGRPSALMSISAIMFDASFCARRM